MAHGVYFRLSVNKSPKLVMKFTTSFVDVISLHARNSG